MKHFLAEDLSVEYRLSSGRIRALDGVDLLVERGEVVGIVGESGSGKSTLGLAAGRLLPPNCERVAGDLLVEGESVWSLDLRRLRELRSHRLGFIFQSPLAALDPTMRVGRQMSLVLKRHDLELNVPSRFRAAGLDDVTRVARSYPHELSGGMAQRVAVSLALAPSPGLIVADEPTASLDSTLRHQVLSLLLDHVREQGATLLLLTHDLATIRRHCRRVVVMYGGRVIEDGPSESVFSRPLHPYTGALLAAAPGMEAAGGRIEAIEGAPPILTGPSTGCSFAPRCRWANGICTSERPTLARVDDRLVLCARVHEIIRGTAAAPDGRRVDA